MSTTTNTHLTNSLGSMDIGNGKKPKGLPQLHLYNSLTRNKDLFRPNNGNQVKFYICGPTVYDSAHMGHARAYLSFDIVRRVLSKYFNYDVLYVMNVTDIDDKIIKRARQNFLYDEYVENFQNSSFADLIQQVVTALEFFKKKSAAETDPDKIKMLYEMVAKLNDTINQIESDLKQQQNGDNKDLGAKRAHLLANAKDILSEWLDHTQGHRVDELSVFSKLAKRFEDDFLEDMCTLNVPEPDVLTRVSEYMPEIVQYVEQIINNGYAYPTQSGSVYFDTLAFNAQPNHSYAKLMPESFGDSATAAKHLRESEGELSIGEDKLQEKKSAADFALWKCSKSGEPFWDSPWGRGRPGWHIECSAMTTAVLGDRLDIHAGGFDLKFPHHDNEIAQCEAYFDADKWTNYFLHCGALKIAGSKMSKSLKNFISIKQVLRQYTARQLRILFLMHTWTDPLDYSEESMQRVLQFEKFCNDFFLTVKDFYRKDLAEHRFDNRKFEADEMGLLNKFFQLRDEIHEALCDSIDTRTVVEKLREIIKESNIYIREKENDKLRPNSKLLRNIAEHITDLLKTFGAIPDSTQEFGFPTEQNGNNSCQNREEQILPVLNALVDFRNEVRNSAKEQKNLEILKACDLLRDDKLPELGVCLEDKLTGTCVKLVDREILLREREERRKFAENKAAEKIRKQKALEEQKLAKQQKQKAKADKEAAALAKKNQAKLP